MEHIYIIDSIFVKGKVDLTLPKMSRLDKTLGDTVE